MVTALLTAAVLSCAMPRHPMPPTTTLSCEGADQVRRDNDGREVQRWPNAPGCTQVRCEGADLVRRTFAGNETSRWVRATQCMSVSCESFDFVRRDSNGSVMERWSFAPQCAPSRIRLSADSTWKFGLSQR